MMNDKETAMSKTVSVLVLYAVLAALRQMGY
jgi:hypothetical protein